MKHLKPQKPDPPKILKIQKLDKGPRPNTCRACAGSKFC